MSEVQPITVPPPALGNWRLANPPSDLTAATNSVVSACARWKPVYVAHSSVAVASPEEGVCHAVQDWSAFGMQRSSAEELSGFVAGIPAGFLLCLAVIVAWRGIRELVNGSIRFLDERQWRRTLWSVRR